MRNRDKQKEIVEKLTDDYKQANKRAQVKIINDHRIKQFELVLEYNALFRQTYEKLKELWVLGDPVIPDDLVGDHRILKQFISLRHNVPPMVKLEEVDIRAVNKLLPMGYSESVYRGMIKELQDGNSQ